MSLEMKSEPLLLTFQEILSANESMEMVKEEVQKTPAKTV